MTVFKVPSESAYGGARRRIMGIESKSIYRKYFYSTEIKSLLAFSWQRYNVIKLLPSGGLPTKNGAIWKTQGWPMSLAD